MSSSSTKSKPKRLKRTYAFSINSPTMLSDDIEEFTIPETQEDPILLSDGESDKNHPVSGEPAGAIILRSAPAMGKSPKVGLQKPKKKNKEENKEKGFRFCAARVFLTYPKCNLEKEELVEFLRTKCKAERWIVAREKHLDGSLHLHAFAFLEKELDTRDVRFFDLKDHHPNIKNGEMKRDWKKAVYYCMKAGDYVEHNLELLDSPDGFTKRYQDLKAWTSFVKQKKYTKVEFPIYLPDEKKSIIPKPTAAARQRHWWLVAPPNWGKSYWCSVTFANTNVFFPISNSDTPFDHYDNEQVILFDDFLFKEEHKAMLQDVGNTVYYKKHVWGRTRFHPKFWPTGGEEGGVRLMIVLANSVPFQWMDQDWFTSRFNILDLTTHAKFNPSL